MELPLMGLPPVAVHVERDGGGQPTALHLDGMALGALPALRRSSPWRNPRRRAQVAAAGATAAATALRLSRRWRS